MTIQQTLNKASKQLKQVSDASKLEAEVLLAHVIKQPRIYLSAHADESIPPGALQNFESLLMRRLKHEPIAYITRGREFYGYYFLVNADVLIPRPETEGLVFEALAWINNVMEYKRNLPIRIADIGTGSGNIIISLALELKQRYDGLDSFELMACDVSPAALSVAYQNAKHYQLEHIIQFQVGHLLTPIIGALDLITANLPYIPNKEWGELPADIADFEPRLALLGGGNGQDLNDQLIQGAGSYLNPKGMLFYETTHGKVLARPHESIYNSRMQPK